MSESRQILDNLYQLKKTLPKSPVAKLDEANTVLHILAVKKEIERATTDNRLKNDYQWLLNELEVHYKELSRKSLLQIEPIARNPI